MNHTTENSWTEVIRPESSLFQLKFGEVWRYRDLLVMFVKRDFVANYKQTILGPLWFFLQPLLTTLTFMLVFGQIAGISTGGVPMPVFYLSGLIIWNYFSDCMNKTATVFRDNASIFGKVYFPRLVMPVSIVVSNLVKLLLQFILFVAVWVYYVAKGNIHPQYSGLILFPVLFILVGIIALGFGMIISALTTKYRDLIFLLTFGTQLLMYATPVIYPMSAITKYKAIIEMNPLTPIIEAFRNIFLGTGSVEASGLGYATVFAFAILFIGTLIFNKVERGFMDTV